MSLPNVPSQPAPGISPGLPAFGTIEPQRVLAQDDLFAVVPDKYPVATGNMVIIPCGPVPPFQGLSAAEKTRLMAWLDWAQEHLQTMLSPAPDGFNMGVNDRKMARPPGRPCRDFTFT